jgi:hypothetical protein
MQTTQDVNAWRGRKAIDQNGERLGKIHEIHAGREPGDPAWAVIGTGLFGMRKRYVPLRDVTTTAEGDLCLPFTKTRIKNAPGIDADGAPSAAQEEQLYRWFQDGLGFDGERTERFSREDERGIRWDTEPDPTTRRSVH